MKISDIEAALFFGRSCLPMPKVPMGCLPQRLTVGQGAGESLGRRMAHQPERGDLAKSLADLLQTMIQ